MTPMSHSFELRRVERGGDGFRLRVDGARASDVQDVALAQRAAAVPAELAEREGGAAAEVHGDVEAAAHGEVRAATGAGDGCRARASAPACTVNGVNERDGHAVELGSSTLPRRARSRASVANRSVGPETVISSAAAPASLPTTRFGAVERRDRSIGPERRHTDVPVAEATRIVLNGGRACPGSGTSIVGLWNAQPRERGAVATLRAATVGRE